MTNASIAQRFLDIATTNAEAPALVFPDVTFSYDQLKSLAAAFALRFREAGLDRSKSIHVGSTDPAVCLPAILAAALLGVRVDAQPDKGDRSQVLITDDSSHVAESRVLVDLSFSPANFRRTEREAIWADTDTDPDAPWFQCPRSSEKSALPFVGLSQSTIARRAFQSRAAVRGSRSRVAVLLPPTSYCGLVRRLGVLLTGGSLLETRDWAFLQRHGATDIILLTAGVSSLVANLADGETDISCEVLGSHLVQGDLEALTRKVGEVTVALDLAETGPVLETTSRMQAFDIEMRQVLSAKVKIADLSERPARIGRLGIALDETAHDWIWPGIAALQHEDRLEVLGPASGHETILVGGHEVDAALIDGLISSTDGIVEAVVFSNPKAGHDDLLCFAIFAEGTNRHQAVKRVEKACREAFGPYAVPGRIRPIDAIPRLPNGQPDRRTCAEMILRAAETLGGGPMRPNS